MLLLKPGSGPVLCTEAVFASTIVKNVAHRFVELDLAVVPTRSTTSGSSRGFEAALNWRCAPHDDGWLYEALAVSAAFARLDDRPNLPWSRAWTTARVYGYSRCRTVVASDAPAIADPALRRIEVAMDVGATSVGEETGVASGRTICMSVLDPLLFACVDVVGDRLPESTPFYGDGGVVWASADTPLTDRDDLHVFERLGVSLRAVGSRAIGGRVPVPAWRPTTSVRLSFEGDSVVVGARLTSLMCDWSFEVDERRSATVPRAWSYDMEGVVVADARFRELWRRVPIGSAYTAREDAVQVLSLEAHVRRVRPVSLRVERSDGTFLACGGVDASDDGPADEDGDYFHNRSEVRAALRARFAEAVLLDRLSVAKIPGISLKVRIRGLDLPLWDGIVARDSDGILTAE